MPWNDNANPGPWGSPPGSNDDRPGGTPRPDPRGRAPPPPPPPPSRARLSTYLRRLRAEWDRRTRGRRGVRFQRLALGAVVVGVLAAWMLSGVYLLQPNQQAIVTRFGAFDGVRSSGLHYRLPAPIERAEVVDVSGGQNTVIGGASSADDANASLMLTGDDKIIDVSFAVRWRVSDPKAYLFETRVPEAALRVVAESAMAQVIGRNAYDSILTDRDGLVQKQALALMRRRLNGYNLGIAVDAVEIEHAGPPPDVAQATQDIARAEQGAQASVNAANAYYSKTVNEATAAAAKLTQAAEVDRQQAVRAAGGEASRFNQVEAQYRLAPAVMRQRLYLQTMQDVLAHVHTVIIGSTKGPPAPIVLPPRAFAPPAHAPAPPSAASPAQGPSL